jgi:osmotically inducible protein OsmC
MATDRTAEVTWHGDLMSGSGRIDSVTSGAIGGLDVDWRARSEDAQSKTSPEELIAAAHAAASRWRSRTGSRRPAILRTS